ncbi:unnamed protein product, partial [Ectocarpus fasciculatus]
PTATVPPTEQTALCDICAGAGLCTAATVTGWRCTGGLPTTDVCGWTGVTCLSPPSVSQLVVTGKGLTGTLSPSIGSLSSLTEINFGNNKLNGAIPSTIGCLTNL